MKGDFTRGIEPDRKRGKRYRRVLVQQSRVLLDSDVAALVDSVDHELRGVTQDLGCALGSPDYGYLITPGRLLALFEHKKGITSTGPGTVMRDYSRKYPSEPESRYPSLRIQNTTATIPLVEPLAGAITTQLAIWYRADAALTISITAGTATTSLNLAQAAAWTRATAAVAIAAGATIADITIASTAPDPVWIGLVELAEDRGPGPHFWAARGRFHAHGLTPELATATGYPEVSYPHDAGFADSDNELAQAPAGTRIVAYLETWERDITAAEDPGIREVALGKVDTTVRTEVKGQVKWALAGALTPPQLRDAFGAVAAPASLLDVSAPTAAPSSDPCAMPTSGGYTGVDHRLYRFEVHGGGSPTNALIKWARDNACHVFPVLDVSGATVTLDRASGLADGDIVEVLSEVVDLDDAARATVSATGVTPATRQVGVLVRLKQEEPDTQGRDRFTLIDRLSPPNTIDPAADPTRYPTTATGLVPLRLRRWDGVVTGALDTTTNTVVAPIEDGITITLDGTFQPGEYWQYEARRGAAAPNPATRTPLGPERIIAPLAVLTLPAATDPAVLEAWLDHRFSPICELDADDIAFDGDRIDSAADTVQEAIEELYERDSGNCCDATLAPNGPNTDDAARITAKITANSFPDGGYLCLEPGVYDLLTPIVIDREVTIRGCPEATLYGHGPGPLFRVTENGRLRIEQLVLYNGPTPSAKVLVEIQNGAHLFAREVGFLAADAGAETAAIATPDAPFTAPVTNASQDAQIDPDALPPSEVLGCHVELRDCVVIAPTGVLGSRLQEMIATRSAFVFANNRGGISADQIDYLALSECSLRGGLPANFFAQVQPGLLRGQSDQLLETAAALPGGGGVAITAQFVLGGELDHNVVRAEIGMWSRVARDFTMHDDEIACPAESWGIRIHHVRRVAIDGERITADVGVEIPLSAGRLTVRQCVVTAKVYGITVSGERVSLGNAGPFLYVNIEGNDVDSKNVGIAIGGGGTQASVVDQVRVAGNIVQLHQSDGGSAILAIGDGQLTSSLVIEGNAIMTDQAGIRVAGSGCLVRGNDMTVTGHGPGITAYGRVGVGLVSVDGNVVAGVSNDFTAIELLDISDVRITDNQVRTSAAVDVLDMPTALSIRGIANASARQYVVGNDFAAGTVRINGANNLNLSANSMRFLTVDSGNTGQNGLIHGNELGAMVIFIFAISASLTGLRGIWKISDNLALGAVTIAGASHTTTIRLPNVFDAISAFAMARNSLASVDRATLNAVIANAGLDGVAPHEMTDVAMRSTMTSLPMTRIDEVAAVALEPGSVIDAIHDTAAIDALGPVLKFIADNPVTLLPITITIIDPFDFHISGNRFASLSVGLVSGTIPAGSSLHVVDNKVTVTLDGAAMVPSSLPRVIAHNSAGNFGVGITTVPVAIISPNLEI